MRFFVKIACTIHQLLSTPLKVFWLCVFFIALSLIFNGSLIRIYALNRDQDRLQEQTIQLQSNIRELDRQIKESQNPAFLERQALERLDLAGENDLIFVFSDDQ